MDKKILASMLIIAVASMLLGAGTVAYFSDKETSKGNTFTVSSASPNLIVWWPVPPYNIEATKYDDETGKPLPTLFDVGDIKPGDSGETIVHVNNIGDVNGILYFNIINVVNDENTCIDPEQKAGDDPVSTEGELGAYLLITVLYGDEGWPRSAYYKAIDDMPLNNLEDNPQLVGELVYEGQGLDGKDIIIQWTLPASTTSIVQTDKVTFDIVFILQQKP
ncbi:MAG: CalY family protein [Candidatus Bathyarchaeota archaeon]|nr:CalY family protein [Candidatus Bathyarchaeota archaeon]